MSKVVYIWGSERPSARLKRLTKVRDKLFEDRKSELNRHAATIKKLDEADAKIRTDIEQVRNLMQDGRYARAAERDVMCQARRSLKKRGRRSLKVIGKPAEPARHSGEISVGIPADSARTREIPPARAELRARSPRRVKSGIDLSTFPSQLANAFPDHDMSVAPENEMTDDDKLAWLRKVRDERELEVDLRIYKSPSGAFSNCEVFFGERTVWEFIVDRSRIVAEFRKQIACGSKTVEDAVAYLKNYDDSDIRSMTRPHVYPTYLEIVGLLNDCIGIEPIHAMEQNATQITNERTTEAVPERFAIR
jgi:hypothetical protein